MKAVYPVLFTEVDTNILIEVPDLDILTEANSEDDQKASIADAIMMARDAIGLKCIELEDSGNEIAKPSMELDVNNGTFSEEGKTFSTFVDVDTKEYRRQIDIKVVRKNVCLPSWLNYEADKAGINVSKVLQDALINVLGVHQRY